MAPRAVTAGRRARRRQPPRWLPAGQALLVAAVLLGWEGVVSAGWASEFFFGRPTELARYLVAHVADGYLLLHTWVTVYEQLLGFLLGTAVGTAIGLVLWWSPFLSRVLEPIAVVLNATPKIAMAPLVVVWFGIGLLSKVMIALLVCGVVAWLTAFEGARRFDADQADMLRALGGTRWHVFSKIVLPGALPWVMSAARINIGLALIGVIAGEFLASTEGLGYLIDKTAKLYQMSHTMAVLGIIAVLAAVEYYTVTCLESRLFRWSRQAELEFIT